MSYFKAYILAEFGQSLFRISWSYVIRSTDDLASSVSLWNVANSDEQAEM